MSHSRSRRSSTSRKGARGKRGSAWWERVRGGLVALPLLIPFYAAWDYGGVLPWTAWLVCLLLLVALASRLPGAFLRRRRLPTASIVLVGTVAAVWLFGMVQTMPLPPAVHAVLSPASFAAYDEWIPEAVRGEAAASSSAVLRNIAGSWSSISVDAWLTRRWLAVPVIFCAAFLYGALALRGRGRIKLMLATATVLGAAIAFLGLVDQIRPDREASAILAPSGASLPFGPFVNRNNAAGFLNICLGCALGWTTLQVRSRGKRSKSDSRYQYADASWFDRLAANIERLFRSSDTTTFAAILLAVVIAAGIFASGSRGGMLAAIAGGVVVAVRAQLAIGSVVGSVAVVVVSIAGAFLLGIAGMLQYVQERLGLITETTNEGRINHWPDALRGAVEYLPFGSGLGTYQFAVLPFDRYASDSWFMNADSMPVEWAVEGGVVVLLLVLTGVVLFVRQLTRLNRTGSGSHLEGLAAAGWFLVVSQIVASSFDFGILLPANASLLGFVVGATSATAGGLVKIKRTQRSRGMKVRAVSAKRRGGLRRFATPALVGGCVGALALAIYDQNVAARTDAAARRLAIWESYAAERDPHRLAAPPLPTDVDEVSARPDAALVAAEALLAEARWTAVAATEPSVDARAVWNRAAISLRRAFYYSSEREQRTAESALFPGQQIERLRLAREHALAALLTSPLDDAPRFQLVETDFVGDCDAASGELLRQIAELRAQNGQILSRAAMLAGPHPGVDAALPLWRQALAHQPQQTREAFGIVRQWFGEEAAVEMLPGDVDTMLMVAESVLQTAGLRGPLLERIERQLASKPADVTDANWHYQRYRAALLAGATDEALDELAAAVEGNPSATRWRFQYASMLEAAGQLSEARQQIERCLLQDPMNRSYLAARERIVKRIRGEEYEARR